MNSPLPGPGLLSVVLDLVRLRRSALEYFEGLHQKHGPVVRVRFAWVTLVVVNDPELARRILHLPHQSANKNTRSVGLLKRVCGESVLTSNGESWFRHRRLVQPAFHHQRIDGFLQIMVHTAAEALTHWANRTSIAPLKEMTDLTFAFICQALFSMDPGSQAPHLQSAIDAVMQSTWRTMQSPSQYPLRLPTPTRRRFRNAMGEIDRFLFDLISKRREQSGGENQDLLGMLMAARDADTDNGMSDAEIRNEAITFMIAGHETTANALSWALLLLAKHPQVQAAAQSEILATLGDRSPSLQEIPALRLVRAVFLETLRLYPPIWLIERNLDTELADGTWPLPAGSQVLICPWVMHRAAQYWQDPTEFRPDRFLTPGAEDNPAFLPFGTGPRACIGRNLAMMEGVVFLAMLLQRFQFSSTPNDPPWQPDAGISLRPPAVVSLQITKVEPAGDQ
jgi:cytochrome P450